ncbi:hypothetical protein K461DRAFT_293335 [Myriangium duriaei CBS 260.36]|uniref:Uncharacterized protein n=1 Tax=Myriangium duriaei CBS 260.36 TaxID=1168546 RepID=A0A9P4J039_9PEZI|nr:hypothetical protein K461DRAFT_293335 [Myriangium duriaei CBS 260.36]
MATTKDMGIVDITQASCGLRHEICYSARMRNLDVTAAASDNDHMPWVCPPQYFNVEIILDVPEDLVSASIFDVTMPTVCQCLESASVWSQLGYECFSSLVDSVSGSTNGHIRLTLTKKPSEILASGRLSRRASGKIYGDATASDIALPPGVPVFHLDSITLNIRSTRIPAGRPSARATRSTRRQHDSLFHTESGTRGVGQINDLIDGEVDEERHHDDDLYEAGGLPPTSPLLSSSFPEHMVDVVHAALRVSITSRRTVSRSAMKIRKRKDFRRLMDLAPAVCKPDGTRALAMHAAFIPSLGRILASNANRDSDLTLAAGTADSTGQGLWYMLHHKVLDQSPGLRIRPLGSSSASQVCLHDFEHDLFSRADIFDIDDDQSIHCLFASDANNDSYEDLIDDSYIDEDIMGLDDCGNDMLECEDDLLGSAHCRQADGLACTAIASFSQGKGYAQSHQISMIS